MNRKAFTLIEVLGIFTIISIILIVALPSVTKILSNTDEGKYEEFKTTVASAAEVHYQINDDIYDGRISNPGDSVNITIKTLIDEGLTIDLPTKPSGEQVTENMVVKVTMKDNGTLDFNFVE